ncbi:MAG: ester cyclase [Chloroflexi bacterium]|nr:ester cyclase [Chloroflexota bacterium]
MSTEQNIALVRRFVQEVMNKGDLAAMDEFFPVDVVDHTPEVPNLPPGREGAKILFAAYRAAFPDYHVAIDDILAEGDKVVWRWTLTGTNQGSMMGMPATGKQVKVEGIDIFRIADGKIVERWASFDQLGMMQQLGAVPAPG